MSIRIQVMQFHHQFGVPVADRATVPTADRVRLRLNLIAEEFCELFAACTEDKRDAAELFAAIKEIVADANISVSLPDVADALGDIAYVTEGANLEFGFNSERVGAEIHAANMRKVGGPTRADGKILKPADWQAPDILGAIGLL
jgi:predicted HAD superfamily Cof-like phosphohydrolase